MGRRPYRLAASVRRTVRRSAAGVPPIQRLDSTLCPCGTTVLNGLFGSTHDIFGLKLTCVFAQSGRALGVCSNG